MTDAADQPRESPDLIRPANISKPQLNGFYEKSIQRFVSLDRVRSCGGLPASMETERRSLTENGGTPGDERGKRPASGGWSGKTETIGEAAVRVQIGSAKSDLRNRLSCCSCGVVYSRMKGNVWQSQLSFVRNAKTRSN